MFSFQDYSDDPVDGLVSATSVLKVVSFLLNATTADLNQADLSGLSDIMDAVARDMERVVKIIEAGQKAAPDKGQVLANELQKEYQRGFAEGRNAEVIKGDSVSGTDSTEMYRQGWRDGWDKCETNFRAELDHMKDRALRGVSEDKTKPGAPVPKLTEEGNGETCAAKSA